MKALVIARQYEDKNFPKTIKIEGDYVYDCGFIKIKDCKIYDYEQHCTYKCDYIELDKDKVLAINKYKNKNIE